MKVGMRTPSPTRSLKAKTTGRANRAIKKSVNPVYGHKGIGYLKDPERAVKNKIYHKVTYDPLEQMKQADYPEYNLEEDVDIQTPPKLKHPFLMILATIIGVYNEAIFIFRLIAHAQLHIIPAVIAIVCIILMLILRKITYED